MAPMAIQRVSIEEGCITCNLCMDTVPEVFLVTDAKGCIVRDDAARHYGPKADEIRQAAAECPVEVIKVTEG